MLFRDGDAIAANVLRFRYVGCLLHLNFERITTDERGKDRKSTRLNSSH